MYRIIPDGAVFEQVAALPVEALPTYAERPMRELVFGGHGEGTITYLLLEQSREVHILLVQWVG